MPGTVIHVAWVRWWSALAYHAFTLACGMARIGRPGVIVAPPGTPLAERARDAGLAPAQGSPWPGLASPDPMKALTSIRAHRRAARAGEVSGVVAHTGRGHAASAVGLLDGPAPLLRVRSDIRRPRPTRFNRWLHRRATDRLLLSGEFMRREDRLAPLGMDPDRIVTLPAGIDPAAADRVLRERERARAVLRASCGWPADTPVLGMLARYSPVKGHRLLVDAAAILCAREPRVRFFIAGPDGQVGRDRVAAWVREAGLEGRFAVRDAVEDPLSVAAGLDAALILSDGSEAVCRSALEYMALELPVIATRVNVIPETIGEGGILIAPSDAAALAREIGLLVSRPDRMRELGDLARRRVSSEFDIEKIARRAAAILDAAREERRGRTARRRA